MIIIIKVKGYFERKNSMNKSRAIPRKTSTKKLKVCTGPGCRAWESKKVLDLCWRFKKQTNGGEAVQVVPVRCLNKCGGGAVVRLSPSETLLKLREPEEAFGVLNQNC